MKRLLIAAVISSALGLSSVVSAAPAPPMFDSEEKAHIRCPLDEIVWLEPKTHRYYFRSSKHYANSGTGGFACLKEAKEAGNKPGE